MTTLNTPRSPVGAVPAGFELLAFGVGAEEYGIDIQSVQELRRYDAVTAIANAPAHLKGVVNLRGSIVPIIDLRIRFGQPSPRYDQFTVVIIVNLGAALAGIVVDSVAEVATLSAEQIQPPPRLGTLLDASALIGLATIDDRVLVLIDIERLLNDPIGGVAAPVTLFH